MQWITQDALNNWTEQNPQKAEGLIPELVAKLILASCANIKQFYFPYGTSVNYPGYDGKVQSDGFSAFVPPGVSVWEVGTNKNTLAKFNEDYKKRTEAPEGVTTIDTSFIFVTPRKWNNKKTIYDVEDECNKQGIWEKVIILDAGKLALWLEKCPPVAAWLANEMGQPIFDVSTLHEYWQKKYKASGQRLSSQFFVYHRKPIISEIQAKILNGTSSEILVNADSSEEALLTIAAEAEVLMQNDTSDILSLSRKGFVERCLIINSKERLFTIDNQFTNIILIPTFPLRASSLEEIKNPVILLSGKGNYPSSMYEQGKVVSIPKRSIHDFSEALENLGYLPNEAYQLANDCKASFPAYFRLIAESPSAKIPEWMSNTNISDLIPALLAGEWNGQNESDKRILSKIAGTNYDEYIERIETYLHGDDVPIFTVDEHFACKNVSEMWKLLFDTVGEKEVVLNRFYGAVIDVLTTPDIRYQTNNGWNAKQREEYYANTCSDNLKKGLIRSLALLMENASKRQEEQAFSIEGKCERTVKNLFAKIHSEGLWFSICQYIPALMEVDPQVLLHVFEDELKHDESELWKLLQDSSYYIYVLRGLEIALRVRAYAKQSISLLSLIAEKDIKYHYANTPLRTLHNYFCLWMPQGALRWRERQSLLKWMIEKYHGVVTKLFRLLLQTGNVVEDLAIFEWRKHDVIQETECERKDIDVSWVCNLYLEHLQPRAEEWEFVISSIGVFSAEEYETKLREQISNFTVLDRLYLIEKIHSTIDRINYKVKAEKVEIEGLIELVRKLEEFEKLIFPGELSCYRPYFENGHWAINLSKGEEQDRNVRFILDLLPMADGNDNAYAKAISEIDMRHVWDWNILDKVKRVRPSVAAEIIRIFYERKGMALFDEIRSSRSAEELGWALSCVLMTKRITEYVKSLKEDECLKSYWKNVSFNVINDVGDKNWVNECVEQMLFCNRPATLINELAYVDWCEPKLVVEILRAAWTFYAEADKNGIGNVQISGHAVESFFDKLLSSENLSLDDVALLEVLYLHAFAPNRPLTFFTRKIYDDPKWYIELLCLTYCRKKLNYSELSQTDYPNLPGLVNLAFERVNGLPGMDGVTGRVNAAILKKWVDEIEGLAEKYQCTRVNDTVLGKILSQSPVGADGIWPTDIVCEILEEHHSEDIKRGFICGKVNQRCVYFVTYGEESRLAKDYDSYAEKLEALYPYTAEIVRCLGKSYKAQANEEKISEMMGNI